MPLYDCPIGVLAKAHKHHSDSFFQNKIFMCINDHHIYAGQMFALLEGCLNPRYRYPIKMSMRFYPFFFF